MTNEEAIEILKLYKQRLEESVSTELGNDIRAFEMAITALSAEQTANWEGIDDEPHEDWECTNCGKVIYCVENPYEEYKFCPNCKSRMKGAGG